LTFIASDSDDITHVIGLFRDLILQKLQISGAGIDVILSCQNQTYAWTLSVAPVLIAAKAIAMAKTVGGRETRRHHAPRIEIAGPFPRQKIDVATTNFGFGRFSIVATASSYFATCGKAGLRVIATKDPVWS